MKNWEFQEWLVAKQLKGVQTPGSGNQRMKGDVYNFKNKFVIEVKSTIKTSIYLDPKWFDKLLKQHLFRGRNFGLCVSIDEINMFYFCTKISFTEKPISTGGTYEVAELPKEFVAMSSKNPMDKDTYCTFQLFTLEELKEYIDNEL